MVSTQAGCLWGSILTTVHKLLCRWSTQSRNLSRFWPCPDILLDMPLVKLIGSCSDILWSWQLSVSALEPLGWDSGADQLRCCLWLALGHLFIATKWYTVCGCLGWVWMFEGRPKLYTKAGCWGVIILDSAHCSNCRVLTPWILFYYANYWVWVPLPRAGPPWMLGIRNGEDMKSHGYTRELLLQPK